MADTVDELDAAMSARCATHPEEAAIVPCTRCGGFMCSGCLLHGTEDRCVTCRPKRTVEERRERRENAVKRSAWMVCEGCGYRGPQFRKVGPPSGGDVILLALLPFLGIGVIIAIVLALRGFTSLSCPGCDSSAALWPAPMEGEVPDRYRTALAREQRHWFGARAKGLAITLAILAFDAMVFVLLIWSAT